jgi:serine phosphatase RsbU (regulator of sigma subunit)/anti-sigma regulatory factor (Ser/Thr protein kinase)
MDSQNSTDQAARAERLAQIINMVEATALTDDLQPFSRTVMRDLYRALMPESVPDIPGWEFEVYYRPADILSADFYDFISLPENLVAISIGDVAGKGSSAALQMAKTSNLIRKLAPTLIHPAAILSEVNQALYKENNPQAYVTCFFAVLDPSSGWMDFANAGHLQPYRRTQEPPIHVDELLITGKPLGIFSEAIYEERRILLSPGDVIIFLSDGVLEARNGAGEMFSAERLVPLLKDATPSESLLAQLREQINLFIGENLNQQDDITVISMRRQAEITLPGRSRLDQAQAEYLTLAEFSLPSIAGNERAAVEKVVETVQTLSLSTDRLENLKIAVIEAVRNAIHHGNRNHPELPVEITIRRKDDKLSITVTDSGNDPLPELPIPDLQAKLSGKQSPFGWGLFLIQQLVDEVYISIDVDHHTIELVMNLIGTKVC